MNCEVYIKFENEVFEFINGQLINDETISWVNRYGNVIGDYELPQGSVKLGFEPKTIIEVKYNMSDEIFVRFESRRRTLSLKNPIVFIFHNEFNGYGLNSQSTRYSFYSLSGLKDKVASSIPCDTDNVVKDCINQEHVLPPGIIEIAKNAFENNRITLFLGAGLSMDAKLPGWDTLLSALLEQKDDKPFVNINECSAWAIAESLNNSAIATGRYVIDGYNQSIRNQSSKAELNLDFETNLAIVSRIREVLYKDIQSSELVNAVTELAKTDAVQQIITYNFDDLVDSGVGSTSFNTIFQQQNSRDRKKPIFHVHGFVPRDDKYGVPVLGEREYHNLYSHMHHWANVIQLNALYTTTCFFIGFSMSDPNLRRLLDLAMDKSTCLDNDPPMPHFVFLRKIGLKWEASKLVNEEHFSEIENMMSQFGLNVVWFNDFKDLPGILLEIANIRLT